MTQQLNSYQSFEQSGNNKKFKSQFYMNQKQKFTKQKKKMKITIVRKFLIFKLNKNQSIQQMGFKVGPFSFSIRKIFFLTVIGSPLIYWHSYRSRMNFMKKLRSIESQNMLSIAEASTQFKELQSDQLYLDLWTQQKITLNQLSGEYKIIHYGGNLAQFFNLQQLIQQNLKKYDMNYYCVLDQSDQDNIDKLLLATETYKTQKIRFLLHKQSQSEIYLLNDQQDVIFYDQIPIQSQEYMVKLAQMVKMKISKDLEKKFIQSLKF